MNDKEKLEIWKRKLIELEDKIISFENDQRMLFDLLKEVKANNVKVIVSSPYFTTSSSDVVAKQTGVKELTLATSTGAFDTIKNYFDLFDYNINHLTTALK